MKFLQLALVFLCCQSYAVAPALYDGRFRPVESAAELQVYSWSRSRQDGLKILQQLHRKGPEAIEEQPLFYVQRAESKALLALPLKQNRYALKTLRTAFGPDALKALLRGSFWQAYEESHARSSRQELNTLAPELWVSLNGEQLSLTMRPDSWPWKQLEPSAQLGPASEHPNKPSLEEVQDILRLISEFAVAEVPRQAPLTQRLQALGRDFRMLPIKALPGQWASLRALATEAENFTPYPDSSVQQLRQHYSAWMASGKERDWKALTTLLANTYAEHLAGTVYLNANGKSLRYPYVWQLKLEQAYSQLPLIQLCIALYALAGLLMMVNGRGKSLFLLGFFLHTAVLLIRSAILERPPVSNMFETVIYVPWITSALSLILRTGLPLAAAGNVVLLLLLLLTGLSQSLENVQAVLDSQYWLSIHVMMVVASYGVFLLAGLLGHLYLLAQRFEWKDAAQLRTLSQSILRCFYIGCTLLIPGTILGGVWAAQSWGRFWDWDPKESWAFISSACYLLWIHAYRFGKIRDLGLAIGSVIGLIAISFTWYGVNYILGTGLHSYGFGSGGELYYYAYLLAELAFLALTCKPPAASKPLSSPKHY